MGNGFSAAEEQRIKEITEKYQKESRRLKDLISSLDIEKDKDAYLAAASEYVELSNKQSEEIQGILDDRDERIIESYQGDTEALVEMLKKELKLFLNLSKSIAGRKLTDEEKAAEEALRERYKAETEAAIKSNDELLEDFPDDEELKKDRANLYELLQNLPPFSLYDEIYGDPKKLYERYVETYGLFLEYLKEHDGYRYYEYVEHIKNTWVQIYGSGNYNYIDGKGYRTRAKALEAGAYSKIPSSLAIPTLQPYQFGMSLYKNGSAYLQPLKTTDGLKFKSGKIYFADMKLISEVELKNMRTKEGIQNIDLATLRIFYSIILTAFEETKRTKLNDVITMYVPDLAEYLGMRRNLSKREINQVIEKAQSFHNIVGVLHEMRNGSPTQSLYPVLNFEGYNDKNNTIAFSSPYMNYLIRTIYNLSLQRDKAGKAKLRKSGKPLTLPSHSYLIDSSIAKERNKAAVENVVLIVTLIEQAGGGLPNMSLKTLIERNVQLAERLDSDPQHRAQLLKRVFTKTWELLKEKTDLVNRYEDLRITTNRGEIDNATPLADLDPKSPAFVPTVKDIETLVYYFPHKGKK